MMNGATQIECTINGIGERAGNCSLEEVVMNLKTRKDYFRDFTTGINTKEIYKTSRMVAELTGISVQRNKAIVGGNAFAHEAGIHQHGMLSHKSTYKIMDPSEVGWTGDNLVIGKHSGKHAIEKMLKDSGYGFSSEQIESVVGKVKELADKQKEVMKEDIIAIANDIAGGLSKDEQIVFLEEFQVTTGNKIKPSAVVTVKIDGVEKTGAGKGVGPVDAVSNALKTTIHPGIKLKEYNLKAITGGTDALANVTIKISDEEGNIFKADGVNEDVIMASAEAIIRGINRALNFQREKIKKSNKKNMERLT